MQDVVIFQNYFTPYRHALFNRLVQLGVRLTVLYAHRPEDEQRAWKPDTEPLYRFVQCQHVMIGRAVAFWVPLRFLGRRQARIQVVLDNNPTNLAMIFWATVLRSVGKTLFVWVECIPDDYKSTAKRFYQIACTRILDALAAKHLAFSSMTERYLDGIGAWRPRARMLQAVPDAKKAHSVFTPKGCRAFGYLGSDSHRKNVIALLNAFGKIEDKEATLHIGGFGALNGYASDSRIIWHGYVEGNAKEYFFEQIDLLVLPSLLDPWGLVVNEALQRGCLCSVSNRCGSSEMVGLISQDLIFAPTEEDIEAMFRRCLALPPMQVAALLERAASTSSAYSLDNAAHRLYEALCCGMLGGLADHPSSDSGGGLNSPRLS